MSKIVPAFQSTSPQKRTHAALKAACLSLPPSVGKQTEGRKSCSSTRLPPRLHLHARSLFSESKYGELDPSAAQTLVNTRPSYEFLALYIPFPISRSLETSTALARPRLSHLRGYSPRHSYGRPVEPALPVPNANMPLEPHASQDCSIERLDAHGIASGLDEDTSETPETVRQDKTRLRLPEIAVRNCSENPLQKQIPLPRLSLSSLSVLQASREDMHLPTMRCAESRVLPRELFGLGSR